MLQNKIDNMQKGLNTFREFSPTTKAPIQTTKIEDIYKKIRKRQLII